MMPVYVCVHVCMCMPVCVCVRDCMIALHGEITNAYRDTTMYKKYS